MPSWMSLSAQVSPGSLQGAASARPSPTSMNPPGVTHRQAGLCPGARGIIPELEFHVTSLLGRIQSLLGRTLAPGRVETGCGGADASACSPLGGAVLPSWAAAPQRLHSGWHTRPWNRSFHFGSLAPSVLSPRTATVCPPPSSLVDLPSLTPPGQAEPHPHPFLQLCLHLLSTGPWGSAPGPTPAGTPPSLDGIRACGGGARQLWFPNAPQVMGSTVRPGNLTPQPEPPLGRGSSSMNPRTRDVGAQGPLMKGAGTEREDGGRGPCFRL